MSNAVLIIGASGSGKSTALRNLDPNSTFIINVLDKPLPFRGYKNNYKKLSKESPEGNYFSSDNWQHLISCIKKVNETQSHIRTLIIDDFNYVMANEFMRRACEKGYDRFSEIAQHAWLIINASLQCRESLMVFILSHSDLDMHGKAKCKTIGKMLDEKISVEGMFSTVLHTQIIDDEYKFLTQGNNEFIAKSPIGMFTDRLIDNDLQVVIEHIKNYNN